MTGVIENCLVPNGSMKIPSHQQLLRYVPVNSRFQVLISRAIPMPRTFSRLEKSTLLVGKPPRGQEKQIDDIIQILKLIYILSFQGPTASFAIQQCVFILYHVTVSCKGPTEFVKLSFLGKKYCLNTPIYFGYNNRSHAPTPGKKKNKKNKTKNSRDI